MSLQMGGSFYYYTGNLSVIICTVQIILLMLVSSYLTERDDKRRFLEKQKLLEEAEAIKEIIEHTTDGIVIYSLKRKVLFSNWIGEKYKWWDTERDFEANLSRVRIQQKKDLSCCFECNMSQNPEDSHLMEILYYVTDEFDKRLKLKNQVCVENTENTHQTQSLMTLAGSIAKNSSDTHLNDPCQLEIRIMSLIFQGVPSLALIFTDITERNMLLTLEDNNNYKNRLLASVSHELRTPLNASINFIQTAIDNILVPQQIRDDYLIPSIRSNQLLLYLINDILDFSQMSANKLRLVYEKNCIKKTIDECLSLIKIQATRKGLKLEVEYDLETPNAEFYTDHNRLRQIILNLLSNSLKFTLQGEIRVKAKVSVQDKFGKMLDVEVSDTGIGISEENQGKLFKAFEKIELGDKAAINSTGVGLGLVISNNLVLMLSPLTENAGLKIKSELDKGTTFSFCIAEQSVHLSPDLYEESTEDSSPENFSLLMNENYRRHSMGSPVLSRRRTWSKEIFAGNNVFSKKPLIRNKSAPVTTHNNHCSSILVVDDDIFNITALEMILKKLGYSCDTVYNGKQAIEKVLERENKPCDQGCEQYKLVFMDYNMPIMDGFEATKKLREITHGNMERMAIIGCTALVQDSEKKKGREFGMDGHCLKPVCINKIRKVLNKYFPNSM